MNENIIGISLLIGGLILLVVLGIWDSYKGK